MATFSELMWYKTDTEVCFVLRLSRDGARCNIMSEHVGMFKIHQILCWCVSL